MNPNLRIVLIMLLLVPGLFVFYGFYRYTYQMPNKYFKVDTPYFIPSSEIIKFHAEGAMNKSVTEHYLIEFIRKQIIGPSLEGTKVSDNKTHFSQAGQSALVDSILHQRKNGFFVECGAATGILLSNSLYFERSRNWTGLLIEANPELFKELMKNNRKSYQLNACLSPTNEPKQLHFKPVGILGGLTMFIDAHEDTVNKQMKDKLEIIVECFSLYHIMQAMGRDHIDYFSLDVEGAEMEILQTIPWNKLQIDVLTVEYNWNQTKLEKMRALMESTGLYKFEKQLGDLDLVFVRKNLT